MFFSKEQSPARGLPRRQQTYSTYEGSVPMPAASEQKTTLAPGLPTLPSGGVFKTAAYLVLKQERRLMTTGDITRVALETGLIRCQGKTPEATMASALYTDIKRRENKSVFTRPQEGLFGLKEWEDEGFIPEPPPGYPIAFMPKRQRTTSTRATGRGRPAKYHYDDDADYDDETNSDSSKSYHPPPNSRQQQGSTTATRISSASGEALNMLGEVALNHRATTSDSQAAQNGHAQQRPYQDVSSPFKVPFAMGRADRDSEANKSDKLEILRNVATALSPPGLMPLIGLSNLPTPTHSGSKRKRGMHMMDVGGDLDFQAPLSLASPSAPFLSPRLLPSPGSAPLSFPDLSKSPSLALQHGMIQPLGDTPNLLSNLPMPDAADLAAMDNHKFSMGGHGGANYDGFHPFDGFTDHPFRAPPGYIGFMTHYRNDSKSLRQDNSKPTSGSQGGNDDKACANSQNGIYGPAMGLNRQQNGDSLVEDFKEFTKQQTRSKDNSALHGLNGGLTQPKPLHVVSEHALLQLEETAGNMTEQLGMDHPKGT